MRFFLFTLSVSLLLTPACSFRSSTETEDSPPAPTPFSNSPPVPVADQAIEQADPAAASPSSVPEFTLDPAPAPPPENSTIPSKEPTPEAASAEDVLNSVARVLRGAMDGANDDTGARSRGSVIGSIGRALSKGFQDAAAAEDATDK